MPSANVEVVRRMHRALRDGDGGVLETVLARHGSARVFRRLVLENADTLSAEIDAYYPVGEELVIGIGHLRRRIAGQLRETEAILVHRVGNGRVVEVCAHSDDPVVLGSERTGG